MSFQGVDITGLANLLRKSDPNAQDDDSDDSDTEKVTTLKHAGPGQIGPSKKKDERGAGDSCEKTAEAAKKSEIWSPVDVSKVADKVNVPPLEDPRKTPKYDMFYRQAVTSEDVFLQMGNKTPSSASCENLVVEIYLPGEDLNKIQLNVKEQAIDLRSPNYFLFLSLPHPIDPKAGDAKWDRDTEKLIVTLKLAREFDGLNF